MITKTESAQGGVPWFPRCLNIWAYRHLILHKSYADFRAESERTYLGIVWWVLEPLILVLVFYLVFGVILERGAKDFVPFLVVGITVWFWFGATVPGAGRTILKNIVLVRQVSFNKIVFPLCAVITNTMKLAFSLAVMFAILWAYGFHVSETYLALPVLLFVQFLLILGISLPLAAIVPFVPDLSNLLDYLIRLVFYMSGIFFAIDSIPNPQLVRILRLNPMATLIENYRGVLMHNTWPEWRVLGWIALLSLVLIYAGSWLIWRFNGLYAKRTV